MVWLGSVIFKEISVSVQKSPLAGVFFSLCVSDSKAAIHNYPSRLLYTSVTYFLSQMDENRGINISFVF